MVISVPVGGTDRRTVWVNCCFFEAVKLHYHICDLVVEKVVISFVLGYIYFFLLLISCFIFEQKKEELRTIIKTASEERMTARVQGNQKHAVYISQSAKVFKIALFLFLFSFSTWKVIAVLSSLDIQMNPIASLYIVALLFIDL
jgi:hypothetical protein